MGLSQPCKGTYKIKATRNGHSWEELVLCLKPAPHDGMCMGEFGYTTRAGEQPNILFWQPERSTS